MNIILATTSPYRRRLLERLQLPFRCVSPETDETPLPDEAPAALAVRLARAKAESIARLQPGALVIGSDQVASIEGSIMGKPGNFNNASAQLRSSSGREVVFYTAIALMAPNRDQERFHVERFCVRFRALSDSQIANYLHREQPYDCAGSFKAEALGISLFTAVHSNDPSALIGLPLIDCCSLLADFGLKIP